MVIRCIFLIILVGSLFIGCDNIETKTITNEDFALFLAESYYIRKDRDTIYKYCTKDAGCEIENRYRPEYSPDDESDTDLYTFEDWNISDLTISSLKENGDRILATVEMERPIGHGTAVITFTVNDNKISSFERYIK